MAVRSRSAALKNDGSIQLASTGHNTDLVFAGNATLTGNCDVVLGDNGHDIITGLPSRRPFFFPFGLVTTLTNASDTIEGGGGSIGGALVLNNEARIVGNGTQATLAINTRTHRITNSGLIEGTTPEGAVIASNVLNSGTLEALGTNASLTLDGAVSNVTRGNFISRSVGEVVASGAGAHVELSSADISGGTLRIGGGARTETIAGRPERRHADGVQRHAERQYHAARQLSGGRLRDGERRPHRRRWLDRYPGA